MEPRGSLDKAIPYVTLREGENPYNAAFRGLSGDYLESLPDPFHPAAGCIPCFSTGVTSVESVLPSFEGPWAVVEDGRAVGVLHDGVAEYDRRSVLDYLATMLTGVPEHYAAVAVEALLGS
ncbi:MAG: hypothetical protein M0Z69_02540 [Actinomycetota bacterium]|nr:hypothetical protein [Actinomycetota bacterium]